MYELLTVRISRRVAAVTRACVSAGMKTPEPWKFDFQCLGRFCDAISLWKEPALPVHRFAVSSPLPFCDSVQNTRVVVGSEVSHLRDSGHIIGEVFNTTSRRRVFAGHAGPVVFPGGYELRYL